MRSRWKKEREIFDGTSLRYSFCRWVWWPLLDIWWSSWPVVLILLFLLFCIGFYGLVVFDSTGLAGFGRWVSDLVNIVFAALFALIVGFVLFRLQVHITERAQKQEVMNLLNHELSELLTTLEEERYPNRRRRFPPKPKVSEIPPEVREPENYETHFPHRFLYSRFLEQAYESGLLRGWLHVSLRDLIRAIHEYDQRADYLRDLAISHDGSEGFRLRYRVHSLRVLQQERTVVEKARSVVSHLDTAE